MALERMGIEPFQTEEIGGRVKQRISTTQYKRSSHKRNAPQKGKRRILGMPTGLTIKIGICVAACALMLGLKELDIPIAADMVSGVRSAVTEETDLDEMLGKLQFVELPNTLEVFSNNNKMALPVSAPNASMQEDAEYVLWEGVPNAVVSAAAAGNVRAIGDDEILGSYVRLTHENDLETIYYGFSEIQVEEGQPIRKYDTLGTLSDEGTLRLTVLLSGRPQSPLEYLDLVKAG